jgi:hypothetical protein
MTRIATTLKEDAFLAKLLKETAMFSKESGSALDEDTLVLF